MIRRFGLLLISALLIFNYAVMLIRVPGGVPVGEAFLVIGLPLALLGGAFDRILKFHPFFIFLHIIWVLHGGAHLLVNIPEYGMWALRDSSNLIDSFYIFFGYYFCLNPKVYQELKTRWIHRIALWTVAYALLYPFRSVLGELLPVITGAAGQTILLPSFVNTGPLLVCSAFYFYYIAGIGYRNGILMVAVCVGLCLSLFIQRMRILQLVAMAGLWGLFAQKRNKRLMTIIKASMLALPVVLILFHFGAQKYGFYSGKEFELNDLTKVVTEIFKESDSGLSSGHSERIEWWAEIHHRMSGHPIRQLVGVGYGMPLIDFKNQHGVVVREPHNDLISMYARLGLVGITVHLLLHGYILFTLIRSIFRQRRVPDGLGFRMYMLMYFVCMHILSIGEPPFSQTFMTIPYYFFAGVVFYEDLIFRKRSIRKPI